MRKIANWALAIAFIIFLIDWGVMGLKLLDHDYNIIVEAYIGFVCWVVILVSIFIAIETILVCYLIVNFVININVYIDFLF